MAPNAKIYEHYEDMLADQNIDIVSICMPNYLHAKEAILAFKADKHIILEKPPVITWEELDSLRDAATKTKKRSVVSFVSRWHPMVKNLHAFLSKQAIGDIFYTEVDYWHGIK